MKRVEHIMGMPIAVEILDPQVRESDITKVFNYFRAIDERFSTYKTSSEISEINAGRLSRSQSSKDMQTILSLAEQTNKETNGYFTIEHKGILDPSGIVKGWAIQNAAQSLHKQGFKHFYIDAGGDIAVSGKNTDGHDWQVGIKNPFNPNENIKVLSLTDCGIATSGTAARGQHIYNPHHPNQPITEIVSLTVIGPNVYEADRFATAAFAMGKEGIYFIVQKPGFDAYMIDANGLATYTTDFERYVSHASS